MKIHLFQKIILSVIFSLFFIAAHSQQKPPPTKEELESMMKNIRRQADSIKNAMTKKGNTGTPATKPTKPVKSQADNFELPKRDTAKISSIPKKRFTLPELKTYLNDLYNQLSRKFPADAVSSAKSIAAKLGNKPAKLEAAALMAWQNGANEEAILLITKGAIESSNDGMVLANAGGLLDMYGLSEKAVPILRTVTSLDPQSVVANNNLGQAFTALGMQDSAMVYFGRCLGASSQHPEANNTAGFIELKRGNKDRAQSYFENSLRGGFNLSAVMGLKTILKEKMRISHLIKPKVKYPEYFNQFKYKLPRQCLNVNEAATVKQEFDNYKKMLSAEMRKIDLLRKAAKEEMGKNYAEEMNKKTMQRITEGGSYMKPYQTLGSAMEAEAILGYSQDVTELVKFDTENREQYKQLEKEYKDALEQLFKSGGRTCASENELKNKYLERFAQVNEEWQTRSMLIENKYIDDLLYWCYFSAFDIRDYKHRFYNVAYNYLYKINRLAQVKIIEPCEEKEPEETEESVPAELKEYDCPDVKFPFLVGKLTINCEKLSFKAGELIVFKYEKKFTGSRQTTISIGGGGGIDADQVSVGPFTGGFSAGGDMSFYLTFDAAGNCSDAGISYKMYRSMGFDFSTGERINISKNLGTFVSEEFGWRFGINSGVSFTVPDNPFFKDKPEVPVNKNVRIYQPN